MIELRAVPSTLLASIAVIAVLGIGWLLSWPAGHGARTIAHRTSFIDRAAITAATTRWSVRVTAIMVACAMIGIAPIAVLQLILVGAVGAAAIAGGIAFGFAGRERARQAMGLPKRSYQQRAKPLPQLGREFGSQSHEHHHNLEHAFEPPPPAQAIIYGLPREEDWVERAAVDRRAPKPRFDWGLVERRAAADRRTFS